MKKQLFFGILFLFLLCSFSHANFVLKITADDTTLSVGETTTVRVWGWVDHANATGDNGLYNWEMNMNADVTGVVSATVNVLNILAPSPVDTGFSGVWNVNAGTTGSFSANAFIYDDFINPVLSTAGVGTGDGDASNVLNYTELISFVVEGLDVGQVQYSLSGIVGELVDFTRFASNEGTVSLFQSDMIDVVPEPSSLLILSGLSILSILRGKKRQ